MNNNYRGGLFLAGFILFIAVAVSLSLSGRKKPELYPGDRIEERSCRMCRGSGGASPVPEAHPAPSVHCRDCGGDGQVRVLVPGPNPPTKVWGVIVERERLPKDCDPKYYSPRNIRPNPELVRRKEVPPVLGGVAGARAVFTKSGRDPITATTDVYGRFSIDIPPGECIVELAAVGYQRYKIRRKMVIEPLTDPIWFEESQTMHQIAMAEGMSDDSARGVYGMTVVGGVSKFSAKRGCWRTSVSYGYY